MSGPVRIQLSRKKGWRMPPNTVKVDRSTKRGNPFTVRGCREAGYIGTDRMIAARCVDAFRVWLGPAWRNNWDGAESEVRRAGVLSEIGSLRGKNLGCWCHLCERHRDGKPFDEHCDDCAPCHVDVMGPLANAPTPTEKEG